MSKKIVLDAGHGGKDSGANGYGLLEKNWTLDIVKRVGNLLSKYEGVSILYTRTADIFVSINDRIAFANKRKADYFFSFHNNAGKGKGFESYISVNASKESKRIQSIITNDVLEFLKSYGVGTHGNATKTDNLAAKGRIGVVTYTHMPAVLFENLFIDTKIENNLLKDEEFKQKLAEVYVSSIAKCLGLKAKIESPSVPKFTRNLKLTKPMTYGDNVKLVQKKLGITVDGWYGPITRRGVLEFQKRVGLVQDGIVGPKTWTKLFVS